MPQDSKAPDADAGASVAVTASAGAEAGGGAGGGAGAGAGAAGGGSDEPDEQGFTKKDRYWLKAIGLRRLRDWVEGDDEEEKTHERRARADRMDEAKTFHTRWAANKDKYSVE